MGDTNNLFINVPQPNALDVENFATIITNVSRKIQYTAIVHIDNIDNSITFRMFPVLLRLLVILLMRQWSLIHPHLLRSMFERIDIQDTFVEYIIHSYNVRCSLYTSMRDAVTEYKMFISSDGTSESLRILLILCQVTPSVTSFNEFFGFSFWA